MPWNVDSIPEPIETLANEYVNNAYEFSTSEASSSSFSIDASHDIDQNTNLNYKQTNQEANMVIPRQRKIILTKYTIYVTNQRMYIVGSNSRESIFRILEIDFTNMEKLIIMEDNVYFTRNEIMEVLNGIEESSEGGLTKKITAVGLLGFIKFTKYYYLLVVTKLKNVANLGGHPIYHIEDTHLIPVTNNHKITDKNTIESRYIQIFLNIDLNNTFYFSYSYDLTNTLQTNMMRNKKQSLGINGTNDLNKAFQFNERFMWNKALLDPIGFDKKYDWFQPIIHGFVDQVQISVFTFQFYIALIARRSHKFAGARFFKRGVNDCGDVANEVETEQIVSDSLTSSFHDTQAGFYNNPRFTSFVQHRGSIPLSWSQETAPNLRMTKPPIELSIIDPFYSKAALHFNNLFERYGCPVQVLNLIKQREKTPRETKLLDAFNDCITYLNQFLPGDKKIDYTEWDMSRASKSKSQDVIKWLENYSDETVKKTGFFHNGNSIVDTQLQQGVCRTNCVDCLDRTNSAQFVIGKRALGYQLHALGFIKEKYLEYDSDVTNILTEMFHDHGDTIALQYGGSHLVNTVQTYRKINQWSSHSRDIIESVKRFYSNSFIDAQRQEAINLFLGNYVYSPLKPMIWELNTDYYLHNTDNCSTVNGTISYTKWFNNFFLTDRKMLEQENWKTHQTNERLRKFQEKGLLTIKVEPYPGYFEHYWNIKYGNRNYTRLNDLFEFNMVSNRQYFTNNEQPKVVNQKIANNETKKLGIFSVFKHNDKSEDNPEQQKDTIKHARFNSFSDRIRGNSVTNKRNFDPENQQDDYFSPFKSRKPHRELKLIYSTNGDEDAIDEDNFEKNDSDYRYLEFANLLGYDLMDDDQLSLNEDLENKQHEFLFNLSQLRNLKKDQALKDNHFLGRAKLFEEAEYTLPIIKICDDAASEKADTAESQRSDEQDEECTIMDEIDESTSTSSYESLSDIFSRFSLSKPQIDESTIKLYKESVNLTYQIPLFREQSRNDKIIGLLEEYSQINGDIMDVKYVDKDGKKIMNIACDDNLSNFDNKFTNYSERRMNAPASNTEYFRFEKNYG